MSLTDQENNFIVAAHVISEGETDRRLEARAIIDRVHFGEDSSDWMFDSIRNLTSLGLLVPLQRDGSIDVQFVQLTAAGARKAERLRDINKIEPLWKSGHAPDANVPEIDVSALFTAQPMVSVPHSDGSTFSDGSGYAQPDPESMPEPVSSAAWTGISSAAVVEGEKLVQLKAFVADAEQQLEHYGFANNRDKAQALALIAAIRIAADAPDPPLAAIMQLLAALGNIASIGGFLLSLGALAVALSK